ncbi:hypothetical protein [Haloimpatiens massiliensis]|uniref:hypothetical protein n=1 Tax=Haloimpatiens massiliensis TaxID=1658110 RepID=UPI000C854A54|nr:hypothetical protein [Haloimpatiens massiliensis]
MINFGVKSKSTKSHTRQIIDIFIYKKALDENNSIFYDDIDLNILDGEKKYLIQNLIEDDFIIVKYDKSMWFNKEKWNNAVNDLTKKYLIILIAPIVITTIILLIIQKNF